MRQVKLQNKLNKVSSKPEEKTMKDSPRLALKKSQEYRDTPSKMATRPASPVPTKDLPSKLNAAIRKIEELKYKAPTATVSKPKSTEKGLSGNVPMGSGSKSKPSSSESSYKNKKKG